MTKKDKTPKTRHEGEQGAVVWLTVYEAAKRRGDVVLATRAKRELAKRGVVIQLAGSEPS